MSGWSLAGIAGAMSEMRYAPDIHIKSGRRADATGPARDLNISCPSWAREMQTGTGTISALLSARQLDYLQHLVVDCAPDETARTCRKNAAVVRPSERHIDSARNASVGGIETIVVDGSPQHRIGIVLRFEPNEKRFHFRGIVAGGAL